MLSLKEKSCQLIKEISKFTKSLIYVSDKENIIVSSNGVKNNVKHDITKLFYGRIILNGKYYNNNGLLKSIYNYFDKIIEKNYKENLEQ